MRLFFYLIIVSDPAIKNNVSMKIMSCSHPYVFLFGATDAEKLTFIKQICDSKHIECLNHGNYDPWVNAHNCRFTLCQNEYSFQIKCRNSKRLDEYCQEYNYNGTEQPCDHLVYELTYSFGFSALFVMCKYQKPYEKIVNEFKTVVRKMLANKDNKDKEIKNKLVLIVSHWDECSEKESAFKAINSMFEGECANIIYCSNSGNTSRIPHLMYKCISSIDDGGYTTLNLFNSDDGVSRPFQVPPGV